VQVSIGKTLCIHESPQSKANNQYSVDYFKVSCDDCPLGPGTAYLNLFSLHKHAVKKLRESNPGIGEDLCSKASVDDVEWVCKT